MKKIIAALSLATLLMGGTAVFAKTRTNHQTKTATISAAAKHMATAKPRRKGKRVHKAVKSTPAAPKASK